MQWAKVVGRGGGPQIIAYDNPEADIGINNGVVEFSC